MSKFLKNPQLNSFLAFRLTEAGVKYLLEHRRALLSEASQQMFLPYVEVPQLWTFSSLATAKGSELSETKAEVIKFLADRWVATPMSFFVALFGQIFWHKNYDTISVRQFARCFHDELLTYPLEGSSFPADAPPAVGDLVSALVSPRTLTVSLVTGVGPGNVYIDGQPTPIPTDKLELIGRATASMFEQAQSLAKVDGR